MSIISRIEAIPGEIEHGLVWLLHAAEHEVPAVIGLFVNIYGPSVVAQAIASRQQGVMDFADREASIAEADTKALIQSSIVERFGLPPTAAQFIASGIHHLFTIGEDKMNALITQGAAAAITATGAAPTPPSVS